MNLELLTILYAIRTLSFENTYLLCKSRKGKGKDLCAKVQCSKCLIGRTEGRTKYQRYLNKIDKILVMMQ